MHCPQFSSKRITTDTTHPSRVVFFQFLPPFLNVETVGKIIFPFNLLWRLPFLIKHANLIVLPLTYLYQTYRTFQRGT